MSTPDLPDIQIEGGWQPGEATWAGSGIYGPQLPELCDVGAAELQAKRSANYPGGHPSRDAAADARAVAQIRAAYERSQAREAKAGLESNRPGLHADAPEPEAEAGL